MLANDILDAVGDTPLVGIQRLSPSPNVRLWAKLEGQNPTGSVKDRIAKAMIEDAEARGLIGDGTVILEPTSGNTGIALAMVCARKGYDLVCAIPENASEERVALLEMYGAQVVFTDAGKGTNGAIQVAQAMAQDPKYFMPFQYGNQANPRAHHDGTGEEIVRDLPSVTHFVAGLGTGGTLTGAGRRLKEHNADVMVIAAEPELGELVYGLRSLDDGYVPAVFDPSILDGKFLVNAGDALRATRDLLAKEGVFAGISSGAVIHAARRVAAKLDTGDVVCLLADGGWKYLSTRAWANDESIAEKSVEETLWW